jgi:hypothetical protein
MADLTVEVLTRETDPELFDTLSDVDYDRKNDTLDYYAELCEGAAEFRMEPHRVGWLSESATHILQLVSFGEVVAFAYLNVTPRAPNATYAELVLLCGSYDFNHGKTVWKGSEVLVDKAMELAKVAGKTALRLEALNETLYKKVYEPMGFQPVPGKRLTYERSLPSGGKKTRRRRQRKTRRRKTKVRGKK